MSDLVQNDNRPRVYLRSLYISSSARTHEKPLGSVRLPIARGAIAPDTIDTAQDAAHLDR